MRIHNVDQRSDEWFDLRAGRITGTDFKTMAAGRTAVETLCLKTAAERITGKPIESNYTNEAMERGIALEDEARSFYEVETFTHVDQVGFIAEGDYLGISPDGLVGDDGAIEIKCPKPHTHLSYMEQKTPWMKYKWQVQGLLWLAGRKWCDFVSYCPDFPPEQQLVISRAEPDEKLFAKLDEGADRCITRIKEIVNGTR